MKLPATQKGRSDLARHLYFVVLGVIGGIISYSITGHLIAPFLALTAGYAVYYLGYGIACFADWVEQGEGDGY